jgi:hypothetical protein
VRLLGCDLKDHATVGEPIFCASTPISWALRDCGQGEAACGVAVKYDRAGGFLGVVWLLVRRGSRRPVF